MTIICQDSLGIFVHICSCHCFSSPETRVVTISLQSKNWGCGKWHNLPKVIACKWGRWIWKGLAHAWASPFSILQTACNWPPSFLHFSGGIPPSAFSLYFSWKLSQWQHVRKTFEFLFLLLQLPEKFCIVSLILPEWLFEVPLWFNLWN